ncbi:MAG: M23 family metallopeptidase [Muribaculaceae bacterium]|nr:M23 family metallopeptidase [Muribaculaceae bacterium]
MEVIEAVGKTPPALICAVDSLPQKNKKDSLLVDYLSDLSGIIKSERTKTAEVSSIFNFIGNAYEENGFYETGNWEGDTPKRRLQIYEGQLPKIDESKLCRPVKGKVTSSFGYRSDSDKMHFGVDLAGKYGDTVSVAHPGVVCNCGFDKKGYGWYVCVKDTTGLETRYAHLSKVLVKNGDKLAYKAPIGLVGSTGNSTGPHLHFEIRYKGKAVNPAFFLLD